MVAFLISRLNNKNVEVLISLELNLVFPLNLLKNFTTFYLLCHDALRVKRAIQRSLTVIKPDPA